MTKTLNDDLIRRVIDCAKEVHGQAGPGLSKDVYEACLVLELAAADLPYESGRILPLIYEGHEFDTRCQTDLIVAETLLLQIEAADEIELIHEQRLRTCLWAGKYPSGLLLNFNVEEMEDGIIHMPGRNWDEQPIHDVFDDPELGAV